VPLARKPFAGHALLVPVQVSAASQVPAAARQVVPEARNWQVVPSQHGLVSSHCSPDSTVPFPQTVAFVIVTVSNTAFVWSIARSVSVVLFTMRTSVWWKREKLQ
jgi:hypothetical protein